MEWYDPAAITTKNGSLQITLSQKETHNLNYQGGMMSTWNKFCFTGGMVETSVILPGAPNIVGLWPAIWTMGNLGERAVTFNITMMLRASQQVVLDTVPAWKEHGHTPMMHATLVQHQIRL